MESFSYSSKTPVYLDVKTRRAALMTSVQKLAMWSLLAFGGAGTINCLSKLAQYFYLFVIPEAFSSRTDEDYNEFSTAIQLSSVRLICSCSS